MNWSTRLRRWVRIRTPPVRVASMKPTAATVLPAPVACSNQKRRSAPGSSGASSIDLLVLVVGCFLPVLRLLVGGQLLVLGSSSSSASSSPSASSLGGLGSASAPRPPPAGRRRCAARRRPRPAARPSARSGCPESASTWCGLSSAPSRSFGGSSASSRSSPSSSEKSRRHSIEGSSAPASSSASAASRARRRAVPGRQRLRPLAVEQEGLAGELRRPLDVGA